MGMRLAVTHGPDRGRVFRYEGFGPLVFGRAGTPDADLQLPTDGHLSRRHLLIEVFAGGARVEALNRDVAFALNGRRSLEAELRSGDRLQVGASALEATFTWDVRPDALASEEVQPEVPRRPLADFELGEEIGRGGLGRVVEALDRRTGERLAIKLLQPDGGLDERVISYFLREMDIVARLEHPRIVPTLCVGREGGDLFIGMERIDGPNLEELVEVSGPLAWTDARAIGMDVLRALEHAHGAGIVHRDVKPQNVLVRGTPGAYEALLVDFGLAKNYQDAGGSVLTVTGDMRGTPSFAAPECFGHAKHAQPVADVYSVGATLFFALTNEAYYGTGLQGGAMVAAILSGERQPLDQMRPDVPVAFVRIIERALQLQAAARFPSAAAMLAALAALEACPTMPPGRGNRGPA